jgi:chromosome segregation ATPase
MSNNSASEETLSDDAATDELPILLETAVLDPEQHRIRPLVSVAGDDTGEHTGEHTLRFPAPGAEADLVADLDALRLDLRVRDSKIDRLERDLAHLSARWQEIERVLAEKDGVIADLNRTLAALGRKADQHAAAEQRLSAEITDRDSQFNRVLEELDGLRRSAAARQQELTEERQAREAAASQLAALRAAIERSAATPHSDERQRLREEVATLSTYIANRREWWDDLDARATASAAKVGELERELAQRAERQQRAEGLAEREAARAQSLRTELVERSRRVEALERELLQGRTSHPESLGGARELRAQLDAASAEIARLRAELAAAVRQLDEAELTEAKRAEEQAAARSAPRTQPKGRRAGAAPAELEQLRRQLAEARAQLDQKRADTARLERALIEKDRALEAREQRVATLQTELDDKLGALQRLGAMDLSLQGLDSKVSERLQRAGPAEGIPTLVCITSEQPKHYALSKKTMTIGRSSRCDVQILTHFVSREHARLTIAGSAVLIEDLGSTNGVFVNAVRIERHELRHSDLVTIGETQFRFLESMAH